MGWGVTFILEGDTLDIPELPEERLRMRCGGGSMGR